jgi:hypothetical protein
MHPCNLQRLINIHLQMSPRRMNPRQVPLTLGSGIDVAFLSVQRHIEEPVRRHDALAES